MVRRRFVWLIAVAVGGFVGALGVIGASAAPPADADATAVTQWNLIAVSTITGVPGPGLPGPAGGAPPASQINMGMVQGAVYDAVNAITPKHHRPYLLNRRFGNTASDEAAVATAAYLVLKNIVETVPQSIAFPNRASPARVTRDAVRTLEERDTRLAVQESGDRCRDRGGAGDDRREDRAMDGSGRPSGCRTANPGHWDPVAPNGTTAQRPDSVGRRRQAVPDAELVAIPQRRSTCAHQRRLGG